MGKQLMCYPPQKNKVRQHTVDGEYQMLTIRKRSSLLARVIDLKKVALSGAGRDHKQVC